MSTSSIENRENIAVGEQRTSLKENLVKPARKMSNSNSGRKTLQTLQPSGKNQSLLVGADGQLRMSAGKKKGNGIYVDPVPVKTSTPERKVSSSKAIQAVAEASSAGTQVEDADTAQARAELFMYTNEFPPDYWKELAEKRREALDISLTENEELHTSLASLQEEKELLQQERDSLKEMAEQAEELAKIVKTLVDDKEDTEEESEDESEVFEEEKQNSDDEDEEKASDDEKESN